MGVGQAVGRSVVGTPAGLGFGREEAVYVDFFVVVGEFEAVLHGVKCTKSNA